MGVAIMLTIAVINSKGGVGKTTLAANLAAILADLGLRVLAVDADVQPTLSSYYDLSAPPAPGGLTKLFASGELSSDLISHTVIDNLDIVLSDDPNIELPNWILNTPDGIYRLRFAIKEIAQLELYDVVIIDSQGALGPMLDAVTLAADILLTPAPPEMLSARELLRGGAQALYSRLEFVQRLGMTLPPMKVVIYRMTRLTDAKTIATEIRTAFLAYHGRVTVLETIIPAASSFLEATTLREPVHRYDPLRDKEKRKAIPAGTVMHQLVHELFPNLRGMYVSAGTGGAQ